MTKNSKIEWTDHTFNPWWGCARVSPGCEHCYAESLAKRTGRAKWGHGVPRVPASEKMWAEPMRWNREAAEAGKRSRVFCASMADVFEDLPELAPLRARLFALILETPHLDWLLLTKRPESAARLWSAAHADARGVAAIGEDAWQPNVWLGTTVEDQRRAEERIPHLIAVPAAVHFLSCEPLLGLVDLTQIRGDHTALDGEGATYLNALRGGTYWYDGEHSANVKPIDWVICGGESGPGARPMHPDWARSLRDQCAAEGVAFHFKQWGEHSVVWERDDDPDDRRVPPQTPSVRFLNLAGGHGFHGDYVVAVKRVGKTLAGRELDGRTHDAGPACAEPDAGEWP